MKKVLILYDSKFGNTRKLALELSSAIQEVEGIITKVGNGDTLEENDLSQYDGVLFGGPTRAFRPTRGAVKAIKTAGKIGLDGKVVSTFGTYIAGNQSRGVKSMDKTLKKVAPNAIVISPGFSAKVEDVKGPIKADELPRAHEWGRMVAQEVLKISQAVEVQS